MRREYHIEPTKEILQKCIDSSCVIKMDKMLDSSMFREISEKGISYIFENLSSIIRFTIDEYADEFPEKYSGNNVRITMEIRDNEHYTTYLIEMIIAASRKDEILKLNVVSSGEAYQ